MVDCNKRKPEQQQQQDLEYQAQLQKLQQQKQHATSGGNSKEPKYRNDENVLPTLAVDYRPISVQDTSKGTLYNTFQKRVFPFKWLYFSVLGEYQTEMGLVVPAITNDLREELFQKMFASGIKVDLSEVSP